MPANEDAVKVSGDSNQSVDIRDDVQFTISHDLTERYVANLHADLAAARKHAVCFEQPNEFFGAVVAFVVPGRICQPLALTLFVEL